MKMFIQISCLFLCISVANAGDLTLFRLTAEEDNNKKPNSSMLSRENQTLPRVPVGKSKEIKIVIWRKTFAVQVLETIFIEDTFLVTTVDELLQLLLCDSS